MAGDPSAERVSRMSVGVIVRRCRGATRWSRWSWKAVAVHAGTGPGGWTEMRRDGDTVDYHAATVLLELHRAETEGYLVALNGHPPAVNVKRTANSHRVRYCRQNSPHRRRRRFGGDRHGQ